MRRFRSKTTLIAAAVVAVGICGGAWAGISQIRSNPSPDSIDTPIVYEEKVVSEDEARAYLDELVAAVQSGKGAEVCEAGYMSRVMCDDARTIDLAPTQQPPPTVLSSRTAYDSLCGQDGILLKIEGTDADGQEYLREFHVTRDDTTNEVAARFTAYWVSGSFSQPAGCSS